MSEISEEKRCCMVCDAKKCCSVCRAQTLFACSDCRITFGVSVYVCSNIQCRDVHDSLCSHQLESQLAIAREGLEEISKVCVCEADLIAKQTLAALDGKAGEGR